MPWPTPVLRQFAKVPDNLSEAEFNGPNNTLLYKVYTLFPRGHHIYGFSPVHARFECADFLVMFEVLLEDKLVLYDGRCWTISFLIERKNTGNLIKNMKRAKFQRNFFFH